jgi:hypothetical protein
MEPRRRTAAITVAIAAAAAALVAGVWVTHGFAANTTHCSAGTLDKAGPGRPPKCSKHSP